MAETRDFYRVLQVHYAASVEIIEAAYRRLCKMYHPDVNHSPGAPEKMKEINRAYEVLKDAEKRKSYDELRKGFAFSGFGENSAGGTEPVTPAGRTMDGYFRSLMEENWESAYRMLSEADRAVIPCEDFYEWKRMVSRSYRMGSYTVKPFRKYEDCAIGSVIYREIQEFSVDITDMNLHTGRVNEQNCIKYTVLENGEWHICAGYSNLKPVIDKFRYLDENASRVDPDRAFAEAVLRQDGLTGLLSRQGFMERAESEAMRHERYGNLFSFALFNIIPGEDPSFSREDFKKMCVARAAEIISGGIRRTDTAGRYGELQIIVLFIETGIRNARIAAQKIVGLLESKKDLDFEVSIGVSEFGGSSVEEKIHEAVSDAQFRRIVKNGVSTSRIYANGSGY